MELNTESILLQGNITGPAFLVKDGIIIEANPAATGLQFVTGAAIEPLIRTGFETYRSYTSGKLYLQLAFGEYTFDAYVTKIRDIHLFCLESDYESESLRLMALLSQHLRAPLSRAMLTAELLQHNPSIGDDPSAKERLGQLNRSLHQLTRAVCNMSDAASYHSAYTRMEVRDVSAVLNEWFPQVAAEIEKTGRTLKYNILRPAVTCLVDEQLLERAILNIISNAAQFSPEGSTITVKLQHSQNILKITIENPCAENSSPLTPDPFHRFLREPGIEDSRYGIGLGMTLIRQAAVAHGGTFLFDSNKKNHVKVILTVSTSRKEPTTLRSPLQVIGGYTGGLDTLLIELSDVLPDSSYEAF